MIRLAICDDDKSSAVCSRIDRNLFCQLHAFFIVNMEFIRSINKSVKINDGTVLPISKRFHNEVKQAHLAFIERRCGS